MNLLELAILLISLIIKTIGQPTLLPDFNFVILGLDPRDDRLEKTQVTDTVIIARLTADSQIKIISLPRDLWHYPLGSKINQIYPLSLKQPDKYRFIESNFEHIFGQPINRTLILTTQNLIDLTDILGGVDVYLEKGFVDDQYPNPEYITNPSPTTPVYKTISFPAGVNHLDKTNVTEFVRSRKSAETAADGGTDVGRIQRQQLLIDAVITKLKSKETYKNTNRLLLLYDFYKNKLTTNITLEDIVSLSIHLNIRLPRISITRIPISTGENQATDLIYYPGKNTFGQWAFIPQDKDYSRLHQFFNQHFSP